MDIHTTPRLCILFLLAVLSVALPTVPRTGAAQSARINVSVGASTDRTREIHKLRPRSVLAPIAGAGVFGMAITTDSSRVVYTIAQGASTIAELYSVPLAGGAAVKLNAPLASGSGGIQWFNMGITADNDHVVYLAQLVADPTVQLYSAPISGGLSVKLNAPLPSTESVQRFFFSPNGQYVIYMAKSGIYSVPLRGGAVKLNDALVDGQSVGDVLISNDSSRIVYRLDQGYITGTSSYYSVPLAGGSPILLDGPFPYPSSNAPLLSLISPNSIYLVTARKQQLADPIELYAIPLTGGPAIKLARLADRTLDTLHFQISPDARWVVFWAGNGSPASDKLYSMPFSGDAPAIKLYGAMNSPVQLVRISPDSRRAVFTAASGSDSSTELYSVPITGGTMTQLNEPLAAGGPPIGPGFSISPDGSRVVYMSSAGGYQLFSAPLTGGTPPVKINGPLIPYGFIATDSMFTPDSRYMLYRAEGTTDTLYDLFSTPSAESGAAHKLNDTVPMVAGAPTDIDLAYVVSLDSRHVVFRGSQTREGARSLYVADIADTGGATIRTLNPNTAARGSVGFTLTINGANFSPGATVRWNGGARATTFVSSIRLTAQISAADLATAGAAQVVVVNPGPSGATSNIAWFAINSPEPTDRYRAFLPLARR